MEQATITGRTSIFTAPVHLVTMGEISYDAATLARIGLPGPISAMASAPVLSCLECGEPASATQLYLDSSVPGECPSCADEAHRWTPELLSA